MMLRMKLEATALLSPSPGLALAVVTALLTSARAAVVRLTAAARTERTRRQGAGPPWRRAARRAARGRRSGRARAPLPLSAARSELGRLGRLVQRQRRRRAARDHLS